MIHFIKYQYDRNDYFNLIKVISNDNIDSLVELVNNYDSKIGIKDYIDAYNTDNGYVSALTYSQQYDNYTEMMLIDDEYFNLSFMGVRMKKVGRICRINAILV